MVSRLKTHGFSPSLRAPNVQPAGSQTPKLTRRLKPARVPPPPFKPPQVMESGRRNHQAQHWEGRLRWGASAQEQDLNVFRVSCLHAGMQKGLSMGKGQSGSSGRDPGSNCLFFFFLMNLSDSLFCGVVGLPWWRVHCNLVSLSILQVICFLPRGFLPSHFFSFFHLIFPPGFACSDISEPLCHRHPFQAYNQDSCSLVV